MQLAKVTGVIDGAKADVWAVLSDFAHPQRIAPTIVGCTVTGEGVGAVRVVESSRGLRIQERLLECNYAAGRFRYEVLDSGDMPFAGVTRYECTVTLAPRPDGGTYIGWASLGAVEGPLAPVEEFLSALYRRATERIADAVS